MRSLYCSRDLRASRSLSMSYGGVYKNYVLELTPFLPILARSEYGELNLQASACICRNCDVTHFYIAPPPPPRQINVHVAMANRTTLVDNNTWNNSHIALVGKAMSSTEDKAYKIMRMLGVDYVLVIFGEMIGYSDDDINKFLWMDRIAEGEHPQDIKV